MSAFFKNAREAIHKKTGRTTNDLLMIGCILIIILANIFSSISQDKFALGLDFSSGSIYTLTSTTNGILENLEEDIYIYPVYSLGNEDATILEILKKYAAVSSLIHLKNASSNSTSAVLETLEETYDFTKEGVLIANSDHTVTTFIPKGDFYLTDDEMNIASIVAESKITSAIESIEKGAFSKIYLLTGHGESKASEISDFLQMLDIKNYQVENYNLSDSTDALRPSTDIVMIISPHTDLLESEFSTLLDFLSLGGKILLFMDNASFNEEQGVLQIYINELPYFDALLSTYGLVLNDDLLICRDPSRINLRSTSICMTAAEHTITRELMEHKFPLVMSECSSIEFTDSRDAQAYALIRTGNNCYAKQLTSTLNNLNPGPTDLTGNFTVAALSQLQNSILILFSDSSCIDNNAFSVLGNKALIEASIDYLSPLGKNTSIPSKPYGTPLSASFNTFSRFVLILISTILLPSGILFFGIKFYFKNKQ